MLDPHSEGEEEGRPGSSTDVGTFAEVLGADKLFFFIIESVGRNQGFLELKPKNASWPLMTTTTIIKYVVMPCIVVSTFPIVNRQQSAKQTLLPTLQMVIGFREVT